LARASERAYRRGFQQGVVISGKRPECIRPALHDWRYGISTDKSPWADARLCEPSLTRLWAENPHLRELGFIREALSVVRPES
jgi:hypothetical protein